MIAADLGGGVIKQRIAHPGQGKSGGFRTLIVLTTNIAMVGYGFAGRGLKLIKITSSVNPYVWFGKTGWII